MPNLAGDTPTQPGSYASLAQLLQLQAPVLGLPLTSSLISTTDPLIPAQNAAASLQHFWPDLYDLAPESHLSRLLGVLLGDAGTGQLRKWYQTNHMSSVVLTMKYQDLDAFYGAMFGVRRMSGEKIDINPYTDTADPDEWVEIDSRDAVYRARVEAFSRAIGLAGTPRGMAALAQAITGEDVALYETFMLVDANSGSNPGGAPASADARTYGDVEAYYAHYLDMENGTYADIEGGSGDFGRTTNQGRSEFIIQPKGQISQEQTYHLIKILNRLKPANALLTVNPNGIPTRNLIKINGVAADSIYWEVRSKVIPAPNAVYAYSKVDLTGQPVVQPKPAQSAYQGERWNYNEDIASVSCYPLSATGAQLDISDYDHHVVQGVMQSYTPDRAIGDPQAISLGKAASSGQLVSSPYAPGRGRVLVG